MDLKGLRNTPPWEWPDGADARLLELLRDGDADEAERLVAAELAGDFTVINEELVEALLALLKNADEPAELRGTAAIALGPIMDVADTDGFDDESDVPIAEDTFRRINAAMQRLYLDASVPKAVRRSVIEASVRAPQPWHRSAVRAAYAADDAEWRLTAVFAMRWISGFDEQILEALDSDDPEVRYHAVCAAGDWEIDAAWPSVAAIVTSEHGDKALLMAAIDALASIRPDQAGEVLLPLTDYDDHDVAEAASDALAMAAAGWPDVAEDDEGLLD